MMMTSKTLKNQKSFGETHGVSRSIIIGDAKLLKDLQSEVNVTNRRR